MAGLSVRQPLPTVQVEQISPFLLLHHFGPLEAEPGVNPFDVAPHPHRGFEPVTFLFSGGIRHKDSLGNEGILEPGDVQWMTAGRGIIHSERASNAFLQEGGWLEGIQLWVNLPKKDKRTRPAYQNIKAADIPLIDAAEGSVRIALVAGTFQGVRGPATTHSPVVALKVEMKAGSTHFFPLPPTHNALVYLLDGQIKSSGGFDYSGQTLLHFRNDGDGIFLQAADDTRLLMLSGEPIDEPVAQWGPYVMNTQTELLEAMRDYQQGKMGFYID